LGPMLRWVFAILGLAAGAGAAVAQSIYGPDEVGARRVCVHTVSLHDLVGLPGVRLVLERERDVIDGTSPVLPPCDRDGSSCGAFEVRTGAKSEACFERVPPGDYFVSAELED
ncbi:MAG: hypothetical protein K8H90_08140, partial [Thermoanaerobaculia bacterium]|nr:hypothetical protein [Thermoanaerobaculia bacterium]